MSKLEILNLEKVIKKTKIIHSVSLELNSGEVVGLLGPNGAGKTTTFYMICGLIPPSNGQVLLDSKDITKDPLNKRARQGIGYLPQESSIFKDLSVEDNLLLAAQVFYKDKKILKEKVEQMLELLSIEPIRLRKGLSLSGGERRRCEIARSLICDPKFLLLDEPFAGVDPIAVAEIQNLINELKSLNIGVLITDHNVRETLAICDRAYVIKSGALLASGSAKEIAYNKDVIKHYLGTEFKFLD
ncbi:LPS export ABC transporter ATP-binding protein [Campylobacter novaezeelandiae]|uniref:LPS export ABC transporter ATP-binding protein n=1 Tax=Campylobacter novaezeelandiae TaxID=2267891 RepID=A0A4V2JQK5_9BACT|nr:LPS export ABC transporter ATP-binding protein [Campylobacter novaezeelandiae]MBK1963953.1 LPS export ABC transporter ATP-binding protein [Campylobacter novaezeelandiae]MBK1993507.1 LPS export ABC transporter ATP-binding protein [Campylobacter novaezeelandiae]QWU80226.1 lipooligosaccharide transport system, ABC transporter ATP-binding component LptB [Campylobacter novaezeelandiae]TBR79350.1 LPS export ABC transporter ATP-binding protein [Campylobacter novaezeelandiae]TBR80001.1 LPS export A